METDGGECIGELSYCCSRFNHSSEKVVDGDRYLFSSSFFELVRVLLALFARSLAEEDVVDCVGLHARAGIAVQMQPLHRSAEFGCHIGRGSPAQMLMYRRIEEIRRKQPLLAESTKLSELSELPGCCGPDFRPRDRRDMVGLVWLYPKFCPEVDNCTVCVAPDRTRKQHNLF